jgi:uncharacterized protein YeeX (DUF496 family)
MLSRTKRLLKDAENDFKKAKKVGMLQNMNDYIAKESYLRGIRDAISALEDDISSKG